MIKLRIGPDFDKLSAEQRQSLDWTRSISIRANAGSGKTSVLIQRIVQILHHAMTTGDDLKLDHIVAITFTRKAAAEMRDRLRKELEKCLDSTNGNEHNFWEARLDELPTCPIGTIDSLCHRTLRGAVANGFIDDIDPKFGILDGIDKQELLDRALERTEQDVANDPDLRAAWDHWMTTQGRGELSRALRALLLSPYSPDDCRRAIDARDKISDEDALQLLGVSAIAHWNDHRERHKRNFDEALKEIRGHEKGRKPSAAVQKMADFLADVVLIASSAPAMQMLPRLRDTFLTAKGEILRKGLADKSDRPYFEKVNALQVEWQPHLRSYSFEIQQIDGREFSRELVSLYGCAAGHFRNLCREENLYDFNYLAERTIEVLGDPKRAGDLTGHFRHVLVDEFQDTNQLHWQIIARVAGEDPEKPVMGSKLMIVGDPQQSIYRFRQADPTVFGRIIELIRQGNKKRLKEPTAYDQHLEATGQLDERASPDQLAGEMRLTANFRSDHPAPLGLIDWLSRTAFDGVEGFEYQGLVAGKKMDGKSSPEVVYLVPRADEAEEAASGAPTENGEQEGSQSEAIDNDQVRMVAAELCRQHDKGIAWKQMCILFRSRNAHLADLEKILRIWNIPYQLVGGLGFWQRQEVRDLVSLAHCLANASDELALFAVLRGPLVGLDDSELLFLSTLGGRNLMRGVHRAGQLHNGESKWEQFELDEAVLPAIMAAYEAIPEARRVVIRQAADRLGYQGSWRQRIDRLPHAELLRLALDDSHAWAVYADGDDGERTLANLRLALDHLRGLEAERPTPLADTARRLKRLVDDVDSEEQAEMEIPAGDAVQVMTVHKAKGLQAAVVAVIGLERQFSNDSPDVWLLDRFQHVDPALRDSGEAKSLHGLPIVRIRHPERPLEKVQPVLHQRLFKIEQNLTTAEEARIFHVAITRAEQVLILSGKAKFKRNSLQNWVQQAFGLEGDFEEQDWKVTGADNLPVRIVRTVLPDPKKAKAAAGPVPEVDLRELNETPIRRTIAVTGLPKMLELYAKNPKEWKMTHVHKVRPHAGEIKQTLLGAEKSVDPELGRLIGTLVHRALEMGKLYPSDAGQAEQWLQAQAAAISKTRLYEPDEASDPNVAIRANQLRGAVNSAQSILKNILPKNPFLGLLEAPGDAEVDFSLIIGNWTITGRFDRLIQNKQGEWEIVDWKTDVSSADEIVKTYREQMRLYALALRQSLAAARRPKRIAVHLAMTHAKASKTLEFSGAELEAYAQELESKLSGLSVL